jgi:hypothetical protein
MLGQHAGLDPRHFGSQHGASFWARMSGSLVMLVIRIPIPPRQVGIRAGLDNGIRGRDGVRGNADHVPQPLGLLTARISGCWSRAGSARAAVSFETRATSACSSRHQRVRRRRQGL